MTEPSDGFSTETRGPETDACLCALAASGPAGEAQVLAASAFLVFLALAAPSFLAVLTGAVTVVL